VPLQRLRRTGEPAAAGIAGGSIPSQEDNAMSWSSVVSKLIRGLTLVPAFFVLNAQAQEAKPLSNEQLDQLTAQVALYPDSLLAQLLMATTYPDDFAAAAGWSKAHPDAKGDDAVRMVDSEPWDPSVASLVAFPEVLITLGEKPDWVKNMGDAFLAQPDDVMNSVQRLRGQAQKAGNLKSNEQIKVSQQTPEAVAAATTVVVKQSTPPPQVIVIEPAQPTVVYVPAYNPTVVYGPWPYPAYPPYYYPPPPGYWFSRTIATGIAWSVGIGVSNALWGGCNWGRGDVNINVNRYNNINVNQRIDVNGNRANWNHNPDRRGKAPYRGGDTTRKNLEQKRDAGNREPFRGRDGARDAARDGARDASRDKAAKSMQDRGVPVAKGSASDRAKIIDRDAARSKAQSADRSAARDRAKQTERDHALKGAGDRQAKQQLERGNASRQAAQKASAPRAGADGGSRPQRPSAGGGAARPGGGGGRPGGGGNRPDVGGRGK
jgi:hypothetical protein